MRCPLPDDVIDESVGVSVHHDCEWLLPGLQSQLVGVVVGLLREPRLEGGREGEVYKSKRVTEEEISHTERERERERVRDFCIYKFMYSSLTFVNLPLSECAVTTDSSKHSDSAENISHMTIT